MLLQHAETKVKNLNHAASSARIAYLAAWQSLQQQESLLNEAVTAYVYFKGALEDDALANKNDVFRLRQPLKRGGSTDNYLTVYHSGVLVPLQLLSIRLMFMSVAWPKRIGDMPSSPSARPNTSCMPNFHRLSSATTPPAGEPDGTPPPIVALDTKTFIENLRAAVPTVEG